MDTPAYDPNLLAIAKFDCRGGSANWDSNASCWGSKIPLGFASDSRDNSYALDYISAMEDSNYTVGLIWEIIPYTAEALADFASRNAKYCF